MMMKERIVHLFMQYYNNRSTRKELDEFFEIINAAKNDNEINDLIKNVYDEIKQNNPSLTYINEEGKLVLQEPDWLYQSVSDEPVALLKSNKTRLLSVAAVALLLISTGIGFWKFRSIPKTTTELAVVKKFTEATEHKYLLLSDSTEVWLNASSSIDYPEEFDGEKREVYLTGEAYFDVKHADKIPFIIHTGKVTTVVLGTAFNIKAYEGQHRITVSVKRGKVRVMQKNKVISTLIKGQEVKVDKITEKYRAIDKITTNEANEVGSWQNGYLAYDDESFEDILSDLQRVYNTEIKIENVQLKGLQVTTSFKREIGVKNALEILCKLTDSKLEITNSKYLLK